ncbi:hypothetical protein HBI68_093400 [Parastagonospora nodorum]|nr:hypothetical protein HBI68_093400 [Parastagonospora nodorum]
MPTPRGQPTRSSQRRNSLQDDTPVRTRAGRGGKSAPFKPEEPDFAPQKSSPTKLSPTTTRKTTRSASNISGRSFEAAPEVYASYEEPLLMVFGLPPSFFDRMKKHHGKLPKERKSLNSSLTRAGDTSDDEQDSELEEKTADESEEESEVEEPPVSQVTPRGRGRGRGGRGGRGRGGRGRGRGRGGRPRGGAARAVSPVRARMSRNVAPMNPLTEEEDDDSANQGSRTHRAKPSSGSNDEPMGEAVDSDDDNDNAIADDESDEDEEIQIVQKASATPGSSPPDGLQDSVLGGTYVPSAASQPDYGPSNKNSRSSKASKALSVPKVQLLSKSATQTPRNATPAEFAVPALLNPEDDVLSDSDLPEPWIEGAPVPLEADCEDRADFLLQKRFKPMVDVQEVIASLTKFAVSQRSTESLYALAENTQNILKHWQDQYLMLDARTAPHMHPAKKACNGGRIPIATDVFEAMKEADLYGYNYDPKKNPEAQDPWGQRPGAEKSGGRELRTRRNRDMLDSAPASEDEDEEDGEGRPAKRQRRATRKFDGSDAGTGTNIPKKHNGWGGARKKGVSRFSKNASETPEPESRPTKRARTAASNLLHQRIQEMREASLVSTGSGDEESSAMEVDDYSDTNVKRGRPAGSKNVARRSDYGVKKGPRKKPGEASAPAPSAHGPNAPPPALQSMSEGQGQFTLDQPLSEPASIHPNSAEGIFQATPHPSASQEMAASQPEMADAYMSTAPLSQYTNNYAEETSPASGSRRKPRVKSEKRSQSMTIWWAERKARKKEQDEKHGTPLKEESRPGSSNERRGGRASTGSAAAASSTTPAEPPRRASLHYPDHPHHYPPPDPYSAHHGPPPLTAPSPMYMFASATPQAPHSLLQYSPLAALPSGGAYPFSGPPPLGPAPQYGARALAPAPLHQQPPSYPAPYGAQSPTSSRPQSSGQLLRNGPPPLAPAPLPHFSPYAPVPLGRERAFQVMVPGPPPGERRGSG